MLLIGYEVHVKKILEGEWRDFFVPESHIHNPILFKRWLCEAHLRPRWKVHSQKILCKHNLKFLSHISVCVCYWYWIMFYFVH